MNADINPTVVVALGLVLASVVATAAGPVAIPAQAFNASTASGWFERAGATQALSGLPAGDLAAGAVRFMVGDAAKGPNAILLAGAGSPAKATEVKGIPVGQKADVIYFLHAFNPGPALRSWDQRNWEAKAKGERPLEPPTLFRYVLHYADATNATVNVRWDEAVNDWRREGPWADPPYAATAWKRTVSDKTVFDPPTAGLPSRWPRRGESAALYAFRFENPRPAQEIASVDMVSANDPATDWGAPALLAISTRSREYEGQTYYVAPGGNDAGPGTFDQPWATPYKAAAALGEGDTVCFRGGRYAVRTGWQDVIVVKGSGSTERPVTFAGYPGETAVIDGDAHPCAMDEHVPYAIFDRDRGLFNIYEKMNVTVRGLWIEKSRKSGIGVYETRNVLLDHITVYGTAHCAFNTAGNTQFRIVGCTLGQNCSPYFAFDAKTQAWTPWKPGHGRAPRAGRETIDNHRNEYEEIAFTEIYWSGKEGISDPGRHIRIHDNHLHDFIHTPDTYWPAGIYLDAYGPLMEDIDVTDNVIYHTASGVSIGSEGGTTATDIRVNHNLIFGNTWEGIGIGPAGNDGLRKNITIEYNTLLDCGHTPWEKGPTGGFILATKNCRDITVRYNILRGHRDYNFTVDPGIDRVVQNIDIHGNLVDPVFLATNRVMQRLRIYNVTNGDRPLTGDPRFVNPTAWDYRLQPDSPAVDVVTDTLDPDGSAADLGAFALVQQLPPLPEAGQGFVLRLDNASDKDFTDHLGRVWKSDRGILRKGNWGCVRREPRPIANTQDPELYLTEWYGMPHFELTVPPGLYRVRMHFAETYGTEPGKRVFSVRLNGRPALEHFDPLAAAGGPNIAVVKEFTVPAPLGKIVVDFAKETGSPLINGIEIEQVTK